VNVTQVQTLLRQYIDEPDQTFVTDAMLQTMLEQAYREFQWTVLQVDENIFTHSVDITLANATSYDLALSTNPVIILGTDANLTAPRMVKLVSIYTTNSDGTLNVPLTTLSSPESLAVNSDGYLLDDTTLRFPAAYDATIRLSYLPEPIAGGGAAGTGFIDWSVATPGTFIDNLSLFHDVIALLAAKQYFILDGAINEPLAMQLQKRTGDLVEYLNTRNYNGAQYVSTVRTGNQFL